MSLFSEVGSKMPGFLEFEEARQSLVVAGWMPVRELEGGDNGGIDWGTLYGRGMGRFWLNYRTLAIVPYVLEWTERDGMEPTFTFTCPYGVAVDGRYDYEKARVVLRAMPKPSHSLKTVKDAQSWTHRVESIYNESTKPKSWKTLRKYLVIQGVSPDEI
jgi:hypothetical protein